MIKQIFKTTCDNCGEEVVSIMGNMSGENDIIVEFMEDMPFKCSCGTTTYLEIQKYSD